MHQNPLLQPWDTPFGLPPYDRIEDSHFEPAMAAALAAAREEIARIAGTADAPSFANTIEALELAGPELEKVASAFFSVAGAASNPERERLLSLFSPMLAQYRAEISANAALFARIETLWQKRDALDLTPEQARVLLLYRRGLVRDGAQLDGAQAERLKEIKTRLAELGAAFTRKVMAEETAWSMALNDTAIATLPETLQQAARAAGEERGASGPVITLSRSLIVPFLQTCPDRALRERAFRAWTARGANGDDNDTRAIVAETLALRHERVRLLGYPDYARFKLETEMAGTPEAVRGLLERVWEPARAAADRDAAVYEEMLLADGGTAPLEPWDWRYYAERRRAQLHDLDAAEVTPFFGLDAMLGAAFDCAGRLFGLEFAEVDVPLYHPDCRAWEVTREGRHLALFIGDYFNRPGKRSGAWCSAIRSQRKLGGEVGPLVVNVCNFAKPPEGRPALLSHDDARTLFHEFGHALHQMLSDVTYARISGTSVARDFVELPSQLYEHWLDEPEVLASHARHVETGAPIGEDLARRVRAAATFDMGFQTVEYLASAFVDLACHEGPPPADPMQRQAEVLEEIGLPRAIAMRHATPHFAHVFSGEGYAAGYYSYLWSEVMDADAFESFAEAGGAFDPERADALETHILSAGGSEEADVLYTRFRGRMPGPEALLRGRGLDRVGHGA